MKTIILAVILMLASRAEALLFNVTYDASVANAPTSFIPAFTNAINFYQNSFTDPITISLAVGWGEVSGFPILPGAVGESATFLQDDYTYNDVRRALIADAKSLADAIAVASLPALDPTRGMSFLMSSAEVKALSLVSIHPLDGNVGFDSAATWTFDPDNRAVPGAYDFIGIAEHEISEVMGRIAFLGTFGTNSLTPLDLFRYSAPGVRALTPGNNQYFSINGGVTNINTFNGPGGGDLGDWSGLTVDAYNAFLTQGAALLVSPGDLTELDIIGYDRAVPEPASLALLSAGLLSLSFLRHFTATKRGS